MNVNDQNAYIYQLNWVS